MINIPLEDNPDDINMLEGDLENNYFGNAFDNMEFGNMEDEDEDKEEESSFNWIK